MEDRQYVIHAVEQRARFKAQKKRKKQVKVDSIFVDLFNSRGLATRLRGGSTPFLSLCHLSMRQQGTNRVDDGVSEGTIGEVGRISCIDVQVGVGSICNRPRASIDRLLPCGARRH